MSVTIVLLILTTAVSIYAFNNSRTFSILTFSPYEIYNYSRYWQFLTSGFLHGDWMHLFVNMFVLFSFGQAVEYYYAIVFGYASTYLFVLLYLSSIAAANVFSYYRHKQNPGFRAVGASGAVSAIVFASILFDPYRPLYLYGLIGVPGIILGAGYLAYSYYMSKRGDDRIDHHAHMYGAIYGILFTICFKPQLLLAFLQKLVGY